MKDIIYEDYLYEMANAVKEDTGLPYDIWLDSAGKYRNNKHHKPRLKVDVDGDRIPVSISDSPKILIPGKTIKKFNEIQVFIKKHKSDLLLHWEGKLTDRQILNLLDKNN